MPLKCAASLVFQTQAGPCAPSTLTTPGDKEGGKMVANFKFPNIYKSIPGQPGAQGGAVMAQISLDLFLTHKLTWL